MDNMHVQLATSVPKPANKKKTTKCVVIVSLQKRGYPSVFKTIGIAPKSAGIGSKFLSRCFFSRRNECGYRVARPVPALFKSTGKGIRPIPTLLKALA